MTSGTRPRVKELFGVLFLDRRIRLGSGVGYAAEIDDPDGRYGTLLRLVDGTRSVPELHESLRGTLGPDEIDQALHTLAEAGYLEDAAAPPPGELSADEVQRYRANINFFDSLGDPGRSKYDHQVRLRNLRVGLIGLGGIGSNVAMALAELGVGTLTAIDFDSVELSNLNRQVLYSTPEVGTRKALSAARRLAAFNPHVEVNALSRRIDSAEAAEAFVREADADVVFCLADKPNGHIDHWVNRACVAHGVPMIAGSIFAANGNAYAVVPGSTACYQCRVDAELERAPELSDEIKYIQDFDFNAVNAATGPSCMFHAYFLVYEMLRIVLGISPPLTVDRLFEINFLTFDQQFTEFPRRTSCTVCGESARIGAPA